MRPRPGQRLITAAAFFTSLGLLAFVWGEILWLLLIFGLVIAGLAYRDAQQAKKLITQLQVSRSLPGVVGRNLKFEDTIFVTNSGDMPIHGEVRDVLPNACLPRWTTAEFRLPPKSSPLPFSTTCQIPVRGKHTFGPVWIRVAGPMGLLEIHQEFDSTGDVKILPETFASRDELKKDLGAQLLLLDKTSRSRQVGAGTEFVSLFPYRHGDDPRRIDWRATARHKSPIVRQFQVERHRDVLIMIDSGRLMGGMTNRGSKLDCAVDAGLNLARVALHSGDRCGIGVFDSTLRGFLPPMAGPRSLGNLVDCVYDLQTQWQETDFTRMFAEVQQRQTKRSLLVILSDLGDAETSRMHCAALARLSQRHLVLFAALRTPVLREIIHQETSTVEQGAQQAVAMGLMRDRSRALFSLKHGGIHVVDVEPQQLTLPLINQFVDLRQRNLL